RAGLIQLESRRPLQIERAEGEDSESFTRRLSIMHEDYFSRIPVRSTDPRLMDRSHFEQKLGNERKRGLEAARRAFSGMLDALQGKREVSQVLVDLFASDDVVVSPACRGCPRSGG